MKIVWYIVFALLLCGCTDDLRRAIDYNVCDLPSLYVIMDEAMLDSIHQTQKVKAHAHSLLLSVDGDTIYDGRIKIKTRGNMTFGYAKKSYTVKFPYAQDLLGLYPAKSFSLLANGEDGTRYLNNSLAFQLAHLIDLPAPKGDYVHLYINNKYRGIYQLVNKVEDCPQLAFLAELKSQNNYLNAISPKYSPTFLSEDKKRRGVTLMQNPQDITGGYLLDYTSDSVQWLKYPSGFISNASGMVRIREPKYSSKEEVNYIADFYNQVEVAVLSKDGYNHKTGKHYSQYINVESFAKYYWVQEILRNCDAGYNSFMMYKNKDSIDSLLYAGPIWDFDLFSPYYEPINILYASAKAGNSPTLLYYLYQHADFREAVKTVYVNEVYAAINTILKSKYIDSLQHKLLVETGIIPYLQQRKDFLYWLWTANEDDILCMQVMNYSMYERAISIYGKKEEGVSIPKWPIINYADPEFVWYTTGGEKLPNDTIFYTNQNVEIRLQKRTWIESQRRRVYKKVHITKELMSLLWKSYDNL